MKYQHFFTFSLNDNEVYTFFCRFDIDIIFKQPQYYFVKGGFLLSMSLHVGENGELKKTILCSTFTPILLSRRRKENQD